MSADIYDETKNVVFENLQERVFKPKRNNFMEFYYSNLLFRATIKFILILGLFATGYALYFYETYGMTIKYIILFSMTIAIAISSTLFLNLINKNPAWKNENLIENVEKNEYMITLGLKVKKFYGDAQKSLFKKNIVKQLLYNAEKFKRHMMILATIGGGKTFLMKGIAEQQTILGGGYFITDGKGTTEFAKEMYAIACLYGREKDFIHINLLDMDNTHSINPLQNGNVNNLYEILIALLIGDEDQWKQKQKEFMKNVLKLLVYKRDFEKLNLNFDVLTEYMSLPKLVNEALLYREEAKKQTSLMDFIKYVSSSIAVDYAEFVNTPIEIDYDADTEIYPKGRIPKQDTPFLDRIHKNMDNTQLQGVYDVTMSVGAWRGVITTLGSDYAKVFNSKEPDISLWEVIQHNKLLFVTLPTMDSDTTPKELGRLLLGLLKGVAQQKAKNAIQPVIPFLCMFDEIGSYIINGFGKLMSKSRSLGISIIPIFQSFAQIDEVDDGKGLETKQMLDVTNTLIIMKVTSPDVTELVNKKLKQTRFIDRSYQEKRKHVNGSVGVEDSFQVLQEDAVKHFEIEKMNNGEMLVITDGEVHRSVANAERNITLNGMVATYEGKDLKKRIPLTQYMLKKDFFKQVEESADFWEMENANEQSRAS